MINLMILYGGASVEYEISLRSAKNIIKNADKTKFNLILVGIDKMGKWYYNPNDLELQYNDSCEPVYLALDHVNFGKLFLPQSNKYLEIAACFPVLHGTYGEDGSVQGLLNVAQIPFVGPDVTGAALCMDKVLTKQVLKSAGIPIAKYKSYFFSDIEKINFETLTQELGLPFMVKPANLGSSVGVNKVNQKSDFNAALNEVFKYDNQIVFEEFIVGREVECAILGNHLPKTTVPGEVVLNTEKYEFYSYDAKYMDEDGAKTVIPAQFDQKTSDLIREVSLKSYIALRCEGMARADLLISEDGRVLLNEINTIPGFTNISMYPQLWAYMGIQYTALITQLVWLAIERAKSKARTNKSFKD